MFDLADANQAKLADQARALLSGQRDLTANAANLAALLYHSLPEVNWVGFYFLKGDELVVGPFQGKPACVTIPLGRGVCGAAAAKRTVVRVADVDAFEGHIACDAASRSEIVLPLIAANRLIGVLDLDSPVPDRFGETDEQLLVEIAEIFIRSVDLPG
jgi:GAF domain-containing protein